MIRHVLPGLGVLPRDLAEDSASGLVGSAFGFARATAHSGMTVELWGMANPRLGPDRYTLDQVAVQGLHPWRIGRAGPVDVRYQLAAGAAAVRARPCRVLHAHALPTLLLLPKGQRRVLHLHMALGRSSRLEAAMLRRADAVICASAYLEASFRASHPEYRGIVEVIRNGADPAAYAEPTPGLTLRRQLGIAEHEVVIAFAGQIAPAKGIDHLLAALALLPPNECPHLLIAGSSTLWRSVDTAGHDDQSPFERELRRASDGLPVTWLGKTPVTQMPAVLLAADIVCCPSVVQEGLATINLEAAAAGKPVVASRVGGIPEIVLDGATGVLTPPGDEAALAAALRRLAEDCPLRERYGREARQRVHTWRQAGDELLAVYGRL